MKKMLVSVLILISTLIFAGSNPMDAYNLVKEGKAIFVDVREESEIQDGIIEKAVWFPMSKVQNDINWKSEFLEKTKGKKIYLYCRSGNRSGRVQMILKEHNIQSENIGGFELLKNELPVVKPGK